MKFPDDFIWGVASSSYQIEGAACEGGKGLSIWDNFCKIPGKIAGGHRGDIACDAYHRFEQDIALMASLGIKNYRFSISWPRILPLGKGEINAAGLAYYDALVDCCLAHGIEPWPTLYHWDLPAALEGGWENRACAQAFADYAGIVAEHFKGRVRHYFTLNEPQCAVALGYESGTHAPGKTLPPDGVFKCWCNMLVANGLAVRKIRQADPDALLGLASTGDICYPETEADIEGARALGFGDSPRWNFSHHWLLDPIILGRFPDTDNAELAALARAVPAEDMATIRVDMDTLGINLYHGHAVGSRDGRPVQTRKYEGFPRTALKWPVTPEALGWGPRFLWERYGLPMYITENGQACNDRIFLDGKVHDPDRIDYLQRYLLELRAAVADGIPVRGYFHWSFSDNFEWSSGYDERFGLVYIDYPSQRRIPKDSAQWYSRVIRENGANL